MKTALELLEELKDSLDETTYNVQKAILEREEFKEEFEQTFRDSFQYDRVELKEAISEYNNQERDKTHFVRTLYYRSGIREFLNKYWDKMNEIIVLVHDKLKQIDEEEAAADKAVDK